MSRLPIIVTDAGTNVSGGKASYEMLAPLAKDLIDYRNHGIANVAGGLLPITTAVRDSLINAGAWRLFTSDTLPNMAAWYKPGEGVTGTLAASAWNDQSDGTKYAYLPGVASNSFRTPDSVANSITGDIDIRAYVAMDDWTPASIQTVAGKGTASTTLEWRLVFNGAGALLFQTSSDGSTTRTATASAFPSYTDGTAHWLRVTYAAATGKVNFYTSDDGSTWAALGAEQTIAAAAIYSGNQTVCVGGQSDGSNPLAGKVYRAQIYSGIAGTLAVDFNPSDSSLISANGDTFTSSTTGEVWTLNNTSTANQAAIQTGNALKMGVSANQPIYLPYSGTPYAYLPGVSGNYFSTPDASANSITGDIDLRVKVAMDDWTPASISTLMAKWDTGTANRSFLFSIRTGGQVALDGSLTGGTGAGVSFTAISTAAVSFSDGDTGWVRVTRASASGNCNFYTSTDGSNWTLLGSANVTSDAGGLFNNTSVLQVSDFNAGSGSQPTKGKIYRAQIYNGIDGTPAVDFNPADFAETSTAGVLGNSSTTLEEWTLNSTGAKPAQIVKSASLLFDGTDDYLKTAAFTLNQPETVYLVVSQISWTANEYFVDGDAGSSMGILTRAAGGGAPDIQLYAGNNLSPHVGPAVGSFGIITAVFNGASSLLQTNATTALTGQAGTTNAGGVTLGAAGSALVPSNIQVKEVLIFSAAHTAAERAIVRNYLNAKHGIY